jgi:hypothetical protein
MKYINTYNAKGQLSQDIMYFWDDDLSQLVTGSKGVYTYNAAGNLTTELMYTWDSDLNDWVIATKYDYTYNAGGHILTMEYSMSMGESWVLFTKENYSYNGQGLLSELLTSSLNFMTFTLENSKKEVYTYNAAGDNTLTMGYKWLLNAWVNDWKDEATFNSNHRNLTTKESTWITESSVWNVDEYTEYNYGANGDLTSMIHKKDETPGLLVNYGKDEITYNNSYTSSDILFPYYFGDVLGDVSTHMFTLVTTYSWVNQAWEFDEKTYFYYSPITITTTPSIADGNIQIYPNPVIDRFNVFTGSDEPSQLSISGLDGRLIMIKTFTGNTAVEVSHLKKGLYIVNVETPGRVNYVRKINVQ